VLGIWVNKFRNISLKYAVCQINNVCLTFVLFSRFKVYDPFSNSCIEIKYNISIDDIDCILHGTQDDVLRIKTKPEHSYRSNIRCHHGKMDEMNRSCICNDGWKSSVNFSIPVVSTVPVHMCTIKIPRKSFYMCPSTLETLGPKNIVSFTHDIDEFL